MSRCNKSIAKIGDMKLTVRELCKLILLEDSSMADWLRQSRLTFQYSINRHIGNSLVTSRLNIISRKNKHNFFVMRIDASYFIKMQLAVSNRIVYL